jgi:hypothetical protein
VIAGFAAATGSMPLRPASLGEPDPLPTFDPHLASQEPQPLDTRSALGPPQVIEASPAFLRLVQVICLLVVIGVVVFLVTLLVRGAVKRVRLDADPVVRAPSTGDSHQEVMAALAQGLAELDEGDPRQAVIACWVRLERAAEDAGVQRKPGDTPTDLVVRLLSGRSVNSNAQASAADSGRLATHHAGGSPVSSVLNDFADVYREARYSPHPVDNASRDQARAALRLLRDELGAGAAL